MTQQEQRPAVEVWKPIETAPKDGSYIIAARFEYRDALKWVLHSRWMTQEEAACEYGGDPSEYLPGWTAGENEDENCLPTHWMRLEAPDTRSAIIEADRAATRAAVVAEICEWLRGQTPYSCICNTHYANQIAQRFGGRDD